MSWEAWFDSLIASKRRFSISPEMFSNCCCQAASNRNKPMIFTILNHSEASWSSKASGNHIRQVSTLALTFRLWNSTQCSQAARLKTCLAGPSGYAQQHAISLSSYTIVLPTCGVLRVENETGRALQIHGFPWLKTHLKCWVPPTFWSPLVVSHRVTLTPRGEDFRLLHFKMVSNLSNLGVGRTTQVSGRRNLQHDGCGWGIRNAVPTRKYWIEHDRTM